jgi:hypothetical protein
MRLWVVKPCRVSVVIFLHLMLVEESPPSSARDHKGMRRVLTSPTG